MKLTVDTKVPQTFATFNIPTNRYGVKYVTGTVVLSSQLDIMIGDGVSVVTGCAEYVLENARDSETIFEVWPVPNTHKKNENDPELFVPKIILADDLPDNSAAIKAALSIAASQIKDAIGLI